MVALIFPWRILMRKGQNPAKLMKSVHKPEGITVAILNYIPFQSGFYAEMLDVLKLCLTSLRNNTESSFDLLVFDNGSCREVCEYLLDQKDKGVIQHLFLSDKNLGKGGAWNIIFDAAPGEIIAYSDNDCLYYKGWLRESLRILKTFPNVGMVTARPFRMSKEYNTATIKWAEDTSEATLKHGEFIPWEVYKSFSMSLGASESLSREWYKSGEDIHVISKGVTAQVGASHYQFVAYKSIIKKFLPFSMSRPMGEVRKLDIEMNKRGYLRLMTVEPYIQNMSNQVPSEYRKSAITSGKMTKEGIIRKISDFPIIRRILLGLYNKIFQIYYD